MIEETLNYSKQKIYDAIKKAAEELELEVTESSPENGLISLFNKGGLFTYGNNIDIKIDSFNSSKSVLKISSESSVSFQLIDWGTNDKLETNLLSEIKKLLK